MIKNHFSETDILATYEGIINGQSVEVDVYIREEQAGPLPHIIYWPRCNFYKLPRDQRTGEHTAFKFEFLPNARSEQHALEHADTCLTIMGLNVKVAPPVGFSTQEDARRGAIIFQEQLDRDHPDKFYVFGAAAPDRITGRFCLYVRPRSPHGITPYVAVISGVRRPVTTMPFRPELS